MAKPLGTTIDNATVERGSWVSLNMERRQYLGVPGFALSAGCPSGQVPSNITEVNLGMLRSALERGFLVLGKTPVQSNKNETELEDLQAALDATHEVDRVKDLLGPILIRKRRVGTLTPYQVLRALTEYEAMHQCRDEVINYIARMMERIPGPRPVTEHERDEEVVQIMDGGCLTAGKEVASMRKIFDGGGGAPESKTPDQREAINDLF